MRKKIDSIEIRKSIIFTYYDLEKYSDVRGITFDNLDFWCSGERVMFIEG